MTRSEASADPEAVGRDVALRKLAAAPRSRAQLDEAMAGKDVPQQVREKLLDRFEECGLVDDHEVARMWVQSGLNSRGLSRRALSYELKKRGIPDDISQTVLNEISEEREEQGARELVQRRMKRRGTHDTHAETRRLVAMLARKGYGPELSYRVVNELVSQESR